MGAFFLATARSGAVLDLPSKTRSAVVRSVLERAPSPAREGGSASHYYCVAGADAHCVETPGSLLLSDGHPYSPSGQTALPLVGTRTAEGGSIDLSTLHGSFALCRLDLHGGDLLLVRDRFGTRPLFWYANDDIVMVASEAKMLVAAGIRPSIDRSVLAHSLEFRWVVSEAHLLSPFRQVPVASMTSIGNRRAATTERYWRIPFAPEPFDDQSLERFVDRTHVAMRDTIQELRDDGARIAVLLSGGVDSSVIAAVAQEVTRDCVAFVGRLPDSTNEELARALEVAAHLGMPCTVVDVTAPASLAEVGHMVSRLEELPRNPNNLVLDQLYRRIAGSADVVLQGDAAEVMFGLADSRSVASFRRKQRLASVVPSPARRLAGRLLRMSDRDRAHRLARLLDTDPLRHAGTLDRIRYSVDVARTAGDVSPTPRDRYLPWHHFDAYIDFDDAMQAFQADTFLVSSLVRHDRLSQPLGLRSLSPFLDDRMVQVACALPRELRYTEFSKPVLRVLCDRFFPPHVARWPKFGFEVPWQTWLGRLLDDGLTDLKAGRAATLLPVRWLDEAERVSDMEAIWSALSLAMLLDRFDIGSP